MEKSFAQFGPLSHIDIHESSIANNPFAILRDGPTICSGNNNETNDQTNIQGSHLTPCDAVEECVHIVGKA